jgi:hypothetical protein
MHRQIKNRLNLDNTCYHSIQKVVFPSATKAIDIKIEKTVVLPALVCRYENWLVTYREEHRFSAFENNAEEYWMHLSQDRSNCFTL